MKNLNSKKYNFLNLIFACALIFISASAIKLNAQIFERKFLFSKDYLLDIEAQVDHVFKIKINREEFFKSIRGEEGSPGYIRVIYDRSDKKTVELLNMFRPLNDRKNKRMIKNGGITVATTYFRIKSDNYETVNNCIHFMHDFAPAYYQPTPHHVILPLRVIYDNFKREPKGIEDFENASARAKSAEFELHYIAITPNKPNSAYWISAVNIIFEFE